MEIVKEREIKGIYQSHDAQKLHGAHYTPNNLAQFVASRILEQNLTKLGSECSIFDPAVGDGELLFALTELLLARGVNKVSIHGFDIDPVAVEAAKTKLKCFGNKVILSILERDFTEEATDINCLKNGSSNLKFDFIIANPPYVRTQSLGAKSSSKLSSEFMLEGRIDLYYVFLLGISKFMHEKTVAGFIVSNRFMSTKSGASVRVGFSQSYSIDEVWDLGDTKLFEAAVLPAVLIFSNKKTSSQETKFVSIYTSKGSQNNTEVKNVFDAILTGSGSYTVGNDLVFEVKAGTLQQTSDPSDVWRVSNTKTDGWLAQVEKYTEVSFGEIGKVRVGVKTTADKVFIIKDWEALPNDHKPESALLKPLITHHFAGRFKQMAGNNRKILYPHITVNGKKQTIDIDQFPNAQRYLNSHRAQLEGREYLIEAGRQWYEIWVPHEPDMWKRPKIVFRDICDRPTFWMDTSGAIVNGDCYWLTQFDGVHDDCLWVALAVANSTFIEAFYDHKFNNKLYAGRRRFMTQYVEQFPIPKLTSKKKDEIVNLTKEIFENLPKESQAKEDQLDKLVWSSFGF